MTGTRNAAIYVRQSLDRTGEGLAVARQLDACRAKTTALGWAETGVYEDNDTSASGRKPRPAYQRMLADLDAGRADAVVVWDLDRLHRQPIELERFLDLADRRGVALASVGGDVDLATDNGRLYARIKGAVGRAEVERKSARQRAASDQRAAAGKPSSGRRAFGYTADGRGIIEHEAAEVRRAASLMLAGGSIRGIVKDWVSRDVRTTAGGPWHPTELRRTLGNPRYAAQRVHRGEIVGAGDWPAVLDLDEWRALQGVLTDPARHKAGRPSRYLLSGLARCAVCDGRIFGCHTPRGRTYMCESRRHVARRSDEVDEMVVGLVLARLGAPDARALFTRPDRRDAAAGLRDEENGLRVRLDGLAEAYAAGEVDRAQLRAGTGRLRARLAVVIGRLADLAVTPVVASLLDCDDVGGAWDGLDLDRRRAVVDTLIGVRLHSPGQGARTFNPETVGVEWKVG